jgi:predicted nucleic acid-binding protein
LIYLDTSVALAHLLAEDRRPPDSIWDEPLVSSRILEYEVWARIHGRGLARSHAELVRQLLGRVAMVELRPEVLSRAVEPFPAPVRTLDALHLATIEFLRGRSLPVQLASCDEGLLRAARKLGIPLVKA